MVARGTRTLPSGKSPVYVHARRTTKLEQLDSAPRPEGAAGNRDAATSGTKVITLGAATSTPPHGATEGPSRLPLPFLLPLPGPCPLPVPGYRGEPRIKRAIRRPVSAMRSIPQAGSVVADARSPYMHPACRGYQALPRGPRARGRRALVACDAESSEVTYCAIQPLKNRCTSAPDVNPPILVAHDRLQVVRKAGARENVRQTCRQSRIGVGFVFHVTLRSVDCRARKNHRVVGVWRAWHSPMMPWSDSSLPRAGR